MLGVSVETIRRWERAGRVDVARTAGGQRVVP
ncbi:MAG: MerR family DNA-binding transcriptional regulator, partial [Chloroflexota bacterium]|nr:MerR family DNA-binding transcriptional regulator [Chloroflexota bacterium]